MKVSVLLSAYNAEDTITSALKSLLNQTYDNFEVVVVNDGSTDQTKAILNAYANPRLHVFNRPHKGLVNALNFGLNQCKGHYIARMDADDYSYPERLALQAEFLDAHPSIAAVTGKVEFGGNRATQEGYARHVDWLNELKTAEDVYRYRFQDSPIANPASMIRNSIFKNYGKYKNNGLPEDYEFWLRILHHGERVQPLPHVVLKWNDSPYRLTRNHPNYSTNAFYKTKALYLHHWMKKSHRLHDEILIFGKGKDVNKRIRPLMDLGITPSYFIDVKQSNSKKVVYYKHLEKRARQLVLSYVSDREGKKEIESFLMQRGFKPEIDFWMMA